MWANTIYSNAEDIGRESKDGRIINACFNPDFARCLKKLIPYLPLWTGIMRRYFEKSSIIATSSSVESEFAAMKRRAFNVKLPIRIDKFVLQRLDYLDGKVKLASNEEDISSEKRRVKDRKITNKDISDSSILRESVINSTASGSETSNYESHKDIESTDYNNGIDILHNDGEIPSIDYEQLKLTENSNKNVYSSFINEDAEDSLKSDSFMSDKDIQSSTFNDCNIWNTCEDWRGKAEKRIDVPKESPIKRMPDLFYR